MESEEECRWVKDNNAILKCSFLISYQSDGSFLRRQATNNLHDTMTANSWVFVIHMDPFDQTPGQDPQILANN